MSERITIIDNNKLRLRIAELEAQVAELGKGESREWVKSTQLDELQARIAELEAALKPFAREAAAMIAKNPEWFKQDQSGVDFITSTLSTTEWWNARAALSDPSGETG